MKSLILVAHGSRRKVSNIEIIQIATQLKLQVADTYQHTGHAFLELAQPSIPDAIEQAIQAGATEVTVLPYFLSAGREGSEAVPAFDSQKQQQHPAVSFKLAPYLGGAKGIIDLLAAISKQH